MRGVQEVLDGRCRGLVAVACGCAPRSVWAWRLTFFRCHRCRFIPLLLPNLPASAADFIEPPHNKRIRTVVYIAAAIGAVTSHFYVQRGPALPGNMGEPTLTAAQLKAKQDE